MLATVVAVQRPTSARPGAHGIVHPDRSVEGWVGGSCARPVVIKEALRSLEDGKSRLLRLTPTPGSESVRADGVVEHLMTCHSGGTLEIFIEPHLPVPALWVAGTTPLAAALAELGAAAGFRVTLADRDAGPDAFPGADRVLNRADLASLDPEARPFVVVATQGQWDEEAVESALRRSPAPAYVGLVASPKRAAAVREYLLEQRLPEAAIASLRAPAGLDLGAETSEEIALSILAELVALRRRSAAELVALRRRSAAELVALRPRPAADLVAVGPGGPSNAVRPDDGATAETAATATTPPTAATRVTPGDPEIVLLDPVCGMTVEREDVRYTSEHGSVVYAFCSITCRKRFEKEPVTYLNAAAPPSPMRTRG